MRIFPFLLAMTLSAENAIVDGAGRVQALLYSGEELAVRTNLVLPTPGWQRTLSYSSVSGITVSRGAALSVWEGSLELAPGQRLNFTQTLREADGKPRITVEYAAGADLVVEGLYFRIDLPLADFKGGRAEFGDPNRAVTLPEVRPARQDLMSSETAGLSARNAAATIAWEARFDRPLFVNLQDKSNEGPPAYTFWVYLHRGTMPAGVRGKFEVELAVSGTPDTAPVRLTLDPSLRRYRLHGFGGNYCFNLESPMTQYTLDNLRSAWARTEMKLEDWEPENDNASPYDVNWAYFEQRDKPGSNLRRGFDVSRQLQQRGIPYAISIWHLPEWLYSDPGQRSRSDAGRRIDPARWDEFLESIGSYLLYARDKYGAEPDLFSFNEPEIGVYIVFSPEEHRDFIKRVGAYFESLGLKTRMLLGDVSHPRGTHTYALPAAEDPEAMKYVGAVSFHSWGGATAQQYQAWGDLAERLGLPLLVAELGTDAAAWRTRSFDAFWYGLNEVRQYQELLLHARPQGTMYWEFTSDYGLLRAPLEPTARFWFTKHFTDLTPLQSDALGAVSDSPRVLFTAFAKEGAYTFHLANLGAAREATLYGLPEDLVALRAKLTSETESFADVAVEAPQAGALRLSLPARCLLTLTNAL
ncbi:MAG: hypothetical protein HY822_22115 [Acidobacteria bacterium]|nr:hypothetical protein [Acidobacteriota bacterium]